MGSSAPFAICCPDALVRSHRAAGYPDRFGPHLESPFLMNRKLLLVVASVTTLAACDGFKEAMTAHVDYVARVGSQELTVTRLAELVGGAQKIPLSKDVAKAVANLWVDYQLLARAASQGDSVSDPAKIDEAFWAELQNMRAQKFYGIVSATWVPDS